MSAESLAHAYAFADADRAKLADLLAKAYLTARVAAYRKAANAASAAISLEHPWTPTAKDTAQAKVWASKQVESIADTWQHTITGLIRQLFVPPATEALDERFIGGLINAAALAKGIAGGAKAFVEWKAPQIENIAMSSGADDGTAQWIDDALSEAEANDPNGVRIRIVPATSSSDACAEYAGKNYSLEESVDLPDFPLHPNCRHRREVYLV